MENLKEAKFSWKALNAKLNEMIDVINRNSPLEGEGIHLDEKGTQGVSINATSPNASGQNAAGQGGGGGGGGGGAGGQWVTIQVVDTASCNVSEIQVWAISGN